MKQCAWIFVALTAVMMLVAGCGKSGSPEAGGKAFASADATTKAFWDKAMAASQSNDYSAAITLLHTLRNQTNLTDAQQRAAQDAFTDVQGRMIEAFNRGDANAEKAMNDLRRLHGR